MFFSLQYADEKKSKSRKKSISFRNFQSTQIELLGILPIAAHHELFYAYRMKLVENLRRKILSASVIQFEDNKNEIRNKLFLDLNE